MEGMVRARELRLNHHPARTKWPAVLACLISNFTVEKFEEGALGRHPDWIAEVNLDS